MADWLIITAFLISQVGTSIAWRATPTTRSDEPIRCCCCQAGRCSCGCLPSPQQESDANVPAGSALCSCGDQPVPYFPPTRVQIERLMEQTLTVSSVDSLHRIADAGRPCPTLRAHGPPPDIGFVTTFVLLI